jgi:murein DD-endopeptidase MepM/ murein hydrolase activator NlpD
MPRQPLRTLLALPAFIAMPLAAVPLVMAQTAPLETGGGPPASQPAAPSPPPPPPAAPSPAALAPAPAVAPAERPAAAPPAAAVAPVAGPGPGSAETSPSPRDRVTVSPERLVPSSGAVGSSPSPLQPGPEQRQVQAPKRFDRSLDDLLRDGVVSPREVRMHDGLFLRGSGEVVREGCSTGAFSARECGASGVSFRSRSDADGPSGTVNYGGAWAGGSVGGGNGERYGIDAAPLPPIAVPVTALLSGIGGRFRLSDVLQVSPRPAGIRGNGNRGLIFPLIGSAEITSGFGWRLHPILGTWLMHSGRDLAAPEGTPVVAALSGRVVSSGDAGGYGLAIEVEHDNPRRNTLYGHLSELYVREGDRVRQGEVIGRVGSTGRSTGPHLHFELRMPQEGGWVAVDPGEFEPGGGGGVQVAGGSQPGLAGLLNPGVAPTNDVIALLMGQLLQSLERPRSPLGTPPAGTTAQASPAPRPLPTDRLPRSLPPSATLPEPAPLPRNLPPAATPGR